jgi:hypothetical protein
MFFLGIPLAAAGATAMATQSVPGVGAASWLLGLLLFAVLSTILIRRRHRIPTDALRRSLVRSLASTPVGRFFGFTPPSLTHQVVAEVTEVVGKRLVDEFSLFLTHGTTPIGCLLVVVPQEKAATIAEYSSLFDTVLHSVANDALADALVAVNANRYPEADRAHRDRVHQAAKASGPKAQVDVAYVSSYGITVQAVFGVDRQSALRRARREFADHLPTDAVVTDVPVEIQQSQTTADPLAHFDGLIHSGKPRPTTSATATRAASPQETRWATPSRAPMPTQPATPVTAVLSNSGIDRTVFLRSGVAVSYGRGDDNTVTVKDDPTMSARHATLTMHGDRLAVHSTGRTGTWVTPMKGGATRYVGVDETVTTALPVRIVFGDAQETVLAVTERFAGTRTA